jgi:hypothetical protein
MSFSPVKNVRIKSLTPGAVVQLRIGKSAVKSPDDVVVTAKLLSHGSEGEKALVVFEETRADGTSSQTTITRYPGAAWRADSSSYVSLVAVDESTFTIQKAVSPVATDSIGDAIKLVQVNADDVYGAEQLVALLTEIQTGKRINAGVKDLANQFAVKVAEELASLPDAEPASA